MATGVLLTGFGGPDSLEAVGPFMRNLSGREPSDELVERVRKRYLAIGGSSPLGEIAGEMAQALREALAEQGSPMPVEVGMRYWRPYIPDGMARLKDAGCDRIVTLSLSPFESKVAHGAYREAIAEAASALGGLDVVEAPLAATLPEYVDLFASATFSTLAELESQEGAVLLFTAHSLPGEDLVADDPYVAGLMAVADAVADQLGVPPGSHNVGEPVLPGISTFGSIDPIRPWFLAYQSKGARPGDWLGPDLDDVIAAAAAGGATRVVVCPIGFMTDHMETLYDLDVVAADAALSAGIDFARVPVPNEDLGLVGAMARMVRQIA